MNSPTPSTRFSRSAVRLLFFLFLLSAAIFCAGTARAASDPDVVSLAKKNTISSKKGKISKKGKHYILKIKGKKADLKSTWFRLDDSVYYINKKGYIQTGIFNYQGFRYFCGSKGKLYINHLHESSGDHLYYFGETGAMVRDKWVTISGNKYYFKSNGRMATNCWVDSVYVDWHGKAVSGVSRSKKSSHSSKWMVDNSGSQEDHLIIIGASRVVQMQEAVGTDSNVTYIAEGGKGLSWFRKSALPLLDIYMTMYPKSTVVVQLGNNDLGKGTSYYSKYWSAYKKLLKAYPKNKIWFMDILPAHQTYEDRNQKAQNFNAIMEDKFPNNYLGGYDYMVQRGYTCTDAYHYDTRTYQTIYYYITYMTGFSQYGY